MDIGPRVATVKTKTNKQKSFDSFHHGVQLMCLIHWPGGGQERTSDGGKIWAIKPNTWVLDQIWPLGSWSSTSGKSPYLVSEKPLIILNAQSSCSFLQAFVHGLRWMHFLKFESNDVGQKTASCTSVFHCLEGPGTVFKMRVISRKQVPWLSCEQTL